MRVLISAAAVLSMAFGANADPFDDGAHWISEPTHPERMAVWPRQGDGKLIYGKALLDCAVWRKGVGDQCKVVREEPIGAGVGAAALKLAPNYRADGRDEAQRYIAVAVEYDTPVQWLRKPTLDDIEAVYPKAAGDKDGRGVVKCTINSAGAAEACSVVAEDPPGLGFGQAAIMLTPSFLFKPAVRAGQPYPTELTIPVRFMDAPSQSADKSTPVLPTTVRVMIGVPWSKAPSAAEVMAAFPDQARGKASEGAVALQCELTKSGGLKGCQTLNAAPVKMGFEAAAKQLAPKFGIGPEMLKETKGELKVNLSIHFLAPDDPRWKGRYLTKVKWTKTIDFSAAQQLFPAQASDAGLDNGLVRLDCGFQANGALGDCRVDKEDPPGLGFGLAGTAIAQAFVAELWTDDGLPIEGARVKMPVRLVRTAATPATKP